MTSENSNAIGKKIRRWGARWLVIVLGALLTFVLIVFALAALQSAISTHWIWALLVMVAFIVVLIAGILDLRRRQLETQQGIQAFVMMLVLTIVVFSVFSFVLNRFGYAHYEGFRGHPLNDPSNITFNFFAFYMWQLFDVIPPLKINEALGWTIPLTKFGFVSGALTLGFRATIILVLLKEFSRWWSKRRSTTNRANEVILKSFANPAETRIFKNGKLELVQIAGMTLGKATYEPGWKWSTDVGTASGAALCNVEHLGLVISGQAMAAFQDGRNVELSPGSLFYIPPVPHDSWVIGDERYVSLHLMGAENYTK